MKKILVLGAGMVSRPGVRYLLENSEFSVTVASRTKKKAERLVEGYENGRALELDVADDRKIEALVRENDIVVSLLPWVLHPKVADLCVRLGKHMATTSYVGPEMERLHTAAKERGLILLNEVGVDPGIDHMSAMQIIDRVHQEEGKIRKFYSCCGGLPAPGDNDNPFGYKFSWSPRGVVLASRSPARYLDGGRIVEIEGRDLFLNCIQEEIEGLGRFERYPNRDSLPFKELYGLSDALTVIRGTYRNLGWCETLKAIVDLGFVDEAPAQGLEGASFREMTADLVGADRKEDIPEKTAEKLSVDPGSPVIKRLEWLGLFEEETVPEADNRLDILCRRLQEKLVYGKNERDMIVLRHRFVVEKRDRSFEEITSTLIDYGIPGGDSSMARTVSLTLGIGVKLIAEGGISETGVLRPLSREIYDPVLAELSRLGIRMEERRSPVE